LFGQRALLIKEMSIMADEETGTEPDFPSGADDWGTPLVVTPPPLPSEGTPRGPVVPPVPKTPIVKRP